MFMFLCWNPPSKDLEDQLLEAQLPEAHHEQTTTLDCRHQYWLLSAPSDALNDEQLEQLRAALEELNKFIAAGMIQLGLEVEKPGPFPASLDNQPFQPNP
ncbi:hypothetical protein CsSME_00024557 [Camellia sinensis var. sinensis]